jgi:hypothetical protein
MVTIMSLWVPILLSTVIVFFVSFIIHTVLPYHRSDFGKVPSQDEVMEALGKFNIPPGDYIIPYSGNPKEMQSPQFIEKMNRGPVAFITVMKSGKQSMTGSLVQWFIYCLVVGIFAAYIAGRALGPGAYYLSVFRFVGATAFIGHSLALLHNSIWYRRNWGATLKSIFDGLIYAFVTAGIFGWLWPGL